MIKISIVVPTYNSANTILRSLDSVFKQTYQNFEVIICDDNSTDEINKILDQIKDDRVKIIYLDNNQGSAVTRNTAMKIAQGEFIAFLDSDDEWYPNKLELQISLFSDRSVGLVFGGAKIVKNNTKTSFYKPQKEWELDSFRKLFLGQISYITSTAIFRKECIDKVGLMEPELRRNQDFDFFLRILKHYNLKIIDKPLAVFNVNTKKTTFNRLQNSISFYENERISFFEENFTQKEINLFFARKYRDLCGAFLRAREYIKGYNSFKRSLMYSSTFILKSRNLFLLFRALVAGIINK